MKYTLTFQKWNTLNAGIGITERKSILLLQFLKCISRINEPMPRIFVLIWMYFSWWFQLLSRDSTMLTFLTIFWHFWAVVCSRLPGKTNARLHPILCLHYSFSDNGWISSRTVACSWTFTKHSCKEMVRIECSESKLMIFAKLFYFWTTIFIFEKLILFFQKIFLFWRNYFYLCKTFYFCKT